MYCTYILVVALDMALRNETWAVVVAQRLSSRLVILMLRVQTPP